MLSSPPAVPLAALKFELRWRLLSITETYWNLYTISYIFTQVAALTYLRNQLHINETYLKTSFDLVKSKIINIIQLNWIHFMTKSIKHNTLLHAINKNAMTCYKIMSSPPAVPLAAFNFLFYGGGCCRFELKSRDK